MIHAIAFTLTAYLVLVVIPGALASYRASQARHNRYVTAATAGYATLLTTFFWPLLVVLFLVDDARTWRGR